MKKSIIILLIFVFLFSFLIANFSAFAFDYANDYRQDYKRDVSYDYFLNDIDLMVNLDYSLADNSFTYSFDNRIFPPFSDGAYDWQLNDYKRVFGDVDYDFSLFANLNIVNKSYSYVYNGENVIAFNTYEDIIFSQDYYFPCDSYSFENDFIFVNFNANDIFINVSDILRSLDLDFSNDIIISYTFNLYEICFGLIDIDGSQFNYYSLLDLDFFGNYSLNRSNFIGNFTFEYDIDNLSSALYDFDLVLSSLPMPSGSTNPLQSNIFVDSNFIVTDIIDVNSNLFPPFYYVDTYNFDSEEYIADSIAINYVGLFDLVDYKDSGIDFTSGSGNPFTLLSFDNAVLFTFSIPEFWRLFESGVDWRNLPTKSWSLTIPKFWHLNIILNNILYYTCTIPSVSRFISPIFYSIENVKGVFNNYFIDLLGFNNASNYLGGFILGLLALSILLKVVL